MILLLRAVRDGTFQYPSQVTLKEYKRYKYDRTPSAMRGFVGYGCSFGGKWFGGLARGKQNGTEHDRMFCDETSRYLRAIRPALQSVRLDCRHYRTLQPTGMLIYCDPPYMGTTQLRRKFNHKRFWEVMREWSKTNDVYISEFNAPPDFRCVYIRRRSTNMVRGRTRSGHVLEERVFKMRD